MYWDPNKDGNWDVSELFEALANKRIRDVVWDPIEMTEKQTWAPSDPSRGTIGGDPFKFKSESEVKKSYQKSVLSDGGISVYWEYDERMEGDKPRSEWRSDDLICTYRHRPKTDDAYCEDVLKTCIWYGYMVYPEMNLEIIYKNFRKWGYQGYLKYDISPDGIMKNEPGTHLHKRNKQEGFNMIRTFLEYRCKKIKHLRFLEECRDISNVEDLTNYDTLASFMVALLGSNSQYAKVMQRISGDTIDISDLGSFFKQHLY